MPREQILCARFSDAEKARIEAVRKSLTTAEWIRWAVLRALREAEK